MARAASVVTGLALLVLTACGGGGSSTAASPSASSPAPVATSPSPSAPTCAPGGTTLEVVAHGVDFDTDCLAAPADTAFTIHFQNQDGIQHNISIEGGGEQFLVGDPVTSGKVTYHVDPIPAGTYTFFCKFHPTEMQGTFVAG